MFHPIKRDLFLSTASAVKKVEYLFKTMAEERIGKIFASPTKIFDYLNKKYPDTGLPGSPGRPWQTPRREQSEDLDFGFGSATAVFHRYSLS